MSIFHSQSGKITEGVLRHCQRKVVDPLEQKAVLFTQAWVEANMPPDPQMKKEALRLFLKLEGMI